MLFSNTRKLERTIREANSYDEWKEAAIAYDEATGQAARAATDDRYHPLGYQPGLHGGHQHPAPYRALRPTRLLAHLSEKEILSLIETGERATWPKIEMIRIQTRISRTLDRIRDSYEIQT